MRVKIFNAETSLLQEIVDSWIKESNVEQMGIELDEDVYLKDLRRLIDGNDTDLLVLENGDKIIGFMGLLVFESPLGRQKIATEHYWYVLPQYRGISSLRLIRAAELWSQEKGCSHLLMNASYLASELHDKVCEIYNKTGFIPFESTYIKKLGVK